MPAAHRLDWALCLGRGKQEGQRMKTQAVVFPEPKRVELWEMELPDPGPDEVLVRTVYSGVSQGTERWALIARYDDYGDDPSAAYPCSPGYQAAGVVAAGRGTGADARARGGGRAPPATTTTGSSRPATLGATASTTPAAW